MGKIKRTVSHRDKYLSGTENIRIPLKGKMAAAWTDLRTMEIYHLETIVYAILSCFKNKR